MEDIYVDLSTMQRFVTALRSSTTSMESALNAMRDTGKTSLGSWALDHAADDFQHTWRYGLGKLKDKTSDTADKMQATYDVYSSVEAALAEAFDKLAEGLRAAGVR